MVHLTLLEASEGGEAERGMATTTVGNEAIVISSAILKIELWKKDS
jgi:hypothetical protein